MILLVLFYVLIECKFISNMRVKYPINTNLSEYRKNREFYINDKLNREDTPIYLFGKRIYA